MNIGKIISVSELGVEILTDGAEVRYRDMLYTELNGKHYRFEVQAVEGSIVNAISFESCAGLKRGLSGVTITPNINRISLNSLVLA